MAFFSGCYVGGGDSENDNAAVINPGEFKCSETITCDFNADGELLATKDCEGDSLFPVDIETLSNDEINSCIDAAVETETSENDAEVDIAETQVRNDSIPETSLEDFFS